MVLGITLGVAVVVAIDLANASASQAFDLSTAAVAGNATHHIVGGPGGLDQELYTSLRRSGAVDIAAPVVSEYFVSPELGGGLLQLMGVDPFVDAPFRNYLGGATSSQNRQPVANLTAFLTRPGTILVSIDLARRYDLEACVLERRECVINLEIGGKYTSAIIAGLLQPSDSLSRRALENVVIADIATAQELTGRLGKIDRIDLILPEQDAKPREDTLRQLLAANVTLLPVEARSGTIEQMTSAFRVNLTALSLLALVVGLFLIYNTMTFSVIQRRPLYGTLRCLGVTRREVFSLVIIEALIVGSLGAVLGTMLGVLMGQGAIKLVSQTINDLFFVVTVRGVQIPTTSLAKGSLLGVFATLLTAALPAWEAASVQPRAALSRSGLESKAQRAVILAAISGLVLLATGIVILLLPTRSLQVSFIATFTILIGSAMLAPVTTLLLARISIPVTGRIWGSLGRLAPRDVINSISRTSIAVAALMVAVSVTIGVSVMVSSFRYTVIAWLEQTLQGDVYISAPTLTSTESSAPVNPEVLSRIESWPGVEQVFTLRSTYVNSPTGPMHIAASSDPQVSDHRDFLATSVPAERIKDELTKGAVIISEPFANRMNIRKPGGSLIIFTDQGQRSFPIVGIYYDYSSTQGTVLMSLDVYRRFWQDPEITAIALILSPGTDSDQVVADLRSHLNSEQRLVIRSNHALRDDVLQIFDRTFAITGAMQLLATIVAFIGVLSALLSLELERQRDMGILRAVGLTVRQLWGLVLLETGLMGTISGILALPTGYLLALILVYIINRRSFGWTLQMQVTVAPFLLALFVAVSAALLAGIYPARRMGKMEIVEAIRYE